MPYKDPEAARAAKRRYYDKNVAKVKAAAQSQRAQNRAVVAKIKEDAPCTDCGVNYPACVMQFDHIGNDKVDHVNRLVRSASLKTVMEEIAKCEVVCANCHALRTYNRLTNP